MQTGRPLLLAGLELAAGPTKHGALELSLLYIAVHQIEVPNGVARRLRGEPETLLAALQRLDLLAQLVLPAPSSKRRV